MSGLVLTRKPGAAVIIDGKIRVTFLGIKGGQARLHFEAPEEVRIMREEV